MWISGAEDTGLIVVPKCLFSVVLPTSQDSLLLTCVDWNLFGAVLQQPVPVSCKLRLLE